jgi:hypothetical protein
MPRKKTVPKAKPPVGDDFKAEDDVFYILPAKIKSVHTDDPEGTYYTISVTMPDGCIVEKQTIRQRLLVMH